jgi:hypothetical protein
MRGAILRPLREWKGRQEAACACMQGSGGGYGHRSWEEDDWAGPTCQREGGGNGDGSLKGAEERVGRERVVAQREQRV